MSTLYLAHFGLHEPPFSITPNPRYFFAGGERGRLLEALTIAVTTDEGITAVTGAVGSGKTLLARLLVARLSEMGWHVAYLANPAFAPNEIVAAIAHDLGVLANPDANGATSVASDPLPGATLLDRLNAALIARYQAGQRTAVVIDEAHAMTPAALDEVRRLANLETAQHKLLQIVLFAQPELTTLLADPLLLPLRERIVHRFTLSPLPKMTVAEYIAFRLRTAGLAGENPFTQAALNRIARQRGDCAAHQFAGRQSDVVCVCARRKARDPGGCATCGAGVGVGTPQRPFRASPLLAYRIGPGRGSGARGGHRRHRASRSYLDTLR